MSHTTHAGWRSRGYLPHFDAPGLVQHVVFRLADSLPFHLKEGLTRLSREQRPPAVDAALDQSHGRRDLARPEIAGLVEAALLRFDGERYQLLAWCVMPNHVHVLIEAIAGHPLDHIVHSWKSFTAHAASRILRRREPFWAPEYFDRYMRDEAHLETKLAYIEGNPVKAGLCAEPADWVFSSARRR